MSKGAHWLHKHQGLQFKHDDELDPVPHNYVCFHCLFFDMYAGCVLEVYREKKLTKAGLLSRKRSTSQVSQRKIRSNSRCCSREPPNHKQVIVYGAVKRSTAMLTSSVCRLNPIGMAVERKSIFRMHGALQYSGHSTYMCSALRLQQNDRRKWGEVRHRGHSVD